MAGQGFHGIGTGYDELDDILPGRGWPSSGLVEVIARHSGMGELQLLIPLMQSVIKQGKWILCVAPLQSTEAQQHILVQQKPRAQTN